MQSQDVAAIDGRLALSQERARSTADERVINAMTIDVEDFFQVSAFDSHVPRDRWDRFESRVCHNTERLLQIFDDLDVTATFFVLGWIADRFPQLVRRIAAEGHEIASHGYGHRLVYEMTPSEFTEDLRRAKGTIQAACGVPVLGYRAPSYSITRKSMWALDALLSEGFVYDASIFPIHHDRYGIPGGPRHPHAIKRPLGTLWELPGSTVRLAGQNLPTAGGGYFRLLPYSWTRWSVRRINTAEGQPAIFYLHPWEIDPHQPRINTSALSRFRHYRNLEKTETRLRRLLKEFRFDTALSVVSRSAASHDAVRQSSPALVEFYAQGAWN